MTLAIAIKINNGLVLATDSASAIGETDNEQTKIHHTYYNADKLYNLKKGSPILRRQEDISFYCCGRPRLCRYQPTGTRRRKRPLSSPVLSRPAFSG